MNAQTETAVFWYEKWDKLVRKYNRLFWQFNSLQEQHAKAVETLHTIRAFAIQLPPDDVDIAGRNAWRTGALNDIANMATTVLATIEEPTDA